MSTLMATSDMHPLMAAQLVHIKLEVSSVIFGVAAAASAYRMRHMSILGLNMNPVAATQFVCFKLDVAFMATSVWSVPIPTVSWMKLGASLSDNDVP